MSGLARAAGIGLGAAIGAAAGLGAGLALAPGPGAALAPAGPYAAPADHSDCVRKQDELSARVAELERRLRASEGTAAAPAPAPARVEEAASAKASPAPPVPVDPPPPPGLAGRPGWGGRAQPGQDPMTPAQKLQRDWMTRATTVAAGSPEKEALVRELRERLRDPDAEIAAAAAQALNVLGRTGKLTAADAAELRGDYDSFPAGSAVRPGLAAAVARALAEDPSLAGFLDSLPRVEEPRIRGEVMRALDGAPSEPFRQLVLRISAEDESPEALKVAWDEDRMLATATRSHAPRIVAAIEPRIARGGLPAEVRGLGYYAISIAGLQAPGDAQAALARAAGREKSPVHASFAQGLEKILASGSATYAELEAYWDRHRRALREEAQPGGR